MQGKIELMPEQDVQEQMARSGWMRRLPFLFVLAVAAFGAVFLRDQLSFEMLAQRREELVAFRDAHYLAAVALFMAGYIAIVAFCLPGGTAATLIGGFLFGVVPGTFFNITSAAIGAVLIFLVAKSSFGDQLARRVVDGGGVAARLIVAIKKNEWSVLFIMRLVPLVPFVLANLIPAFTGSSLFRYSVTTVLGIVPGALVFTSVGAGLGEVFEQGTTPDLGIIFTPSILLPLLGLAALAALPMVLRAFRKDF
jgi:uncharacterized membrane protein YdjX (TVP38/TMEM64 family)